MLVKVTKDTVKIVDEDYVLNKKEYKVNTCIFEFSEEYTEDLVKKAIFEHGDTKVEMVIANNECDIPYEVLVYDNFNLRVYAYELENDELVLRYSPTYTTAYLREGSYIEGATQGEEITPTQFEQYQKALNDGLVEVNEKLTDVDIAIIEANNLDAEVTKSANISTLSLTKKDGTIQSVNILDGAKGDTGNSGRDGVDGITPTIGDNGNWYLGEIDTGKPSRGEQGLKGDKGDKGDTGATGSQGPQGERGPQGIQGEQGPKGDTGLQGPKGDTGAKGDKGDPGQDGQDGADGVGVPSGGTTGQVLSKASGTDYDTQWINSPAPDMSNYYTKSETNEAIENEKVIFNLDLPSSVSTSVTTKQTVNASSLSTDQVEQINRIIEKGFTNAIINIRMWANYQSFTVNYSTQATGSDFIRYQYVNLFTQTIGQKNFIINFGITLTNGELSSIDIQFNQASGYVCRYELDNYLPTSKVKTALNTTSGNVYDVTYINSVVGDIESLLNGI